MDNRRYNVARMELDSLKCWANSYLRRRPIEVAISGTGRSRLQGNGAHLVKTSQHRINMADHLENGFNLETFLEAREWLDQEIGEDNWCYSNMTYYFQNTDDMFQFKLRYLCNE